MRRENPLEARISATDLSRSLSDVLSRVRYREEKFVIERNGETIALLSPLGPGPRTTMRQLVELVKDIPRPDDGFADDVEALRASQQQAELPPWRRS